MAEMIQTNFNIPNIKCIYPGIYRIVPNRCAVREWEGLGACLLISQKSDECG